MNSPAVSVIMPVYNGLPYLSEAVESILRQTYSDFELLLIDDGSTDGSRRYIESLNDHRLRLFFREHKGLIDVLNFGLSQARSDLIARMDSDDIALPERFQRQIEFMMAHEEVVVLGTYVQEIDHIGRPTGTVIAQPQQHEDIQSRFTGIRRLNPIVHPSVMFRREAAIQCGGYCAAFPVAEDFGMWRRMARIGRLHILNEPLLLLRKHQNNISVVKRVECVESVLRVQVSHKIWDITGVDIMQQYPLLWQEAQQLIRDLIKKMRIVESIQARSLLKKAFSTAGRCPFKMLWYLLQRPSLVIGLFLYQIRLRLVEKVSRQIAVKVKANDIEIH